MESQNSQKKKDLIDNWNRLLDWIKSCDTKASIVLAATGIFLTILSSNLMKNINKILFNVIHHFNFANFLYLLFLSIAFMLFIYGAYCLINVLVPRLKEDITKDDNEMIDNSLLYFEGIVRHPFSDFKEKILSVSEEDEYADIVTQIYINAQICKIKYGYFKKGIIYSFIGIASILILYLIGMILLKTGGFY